MYTAYGIVTLKESEWSNITKTTLFVIIWSVREIANSDMTKLHHVCPLGSTRFRLDGFPWNLRILRKYVQKSQVSLKSEKNNGYFA